MFDSPIISEPLTWEYLFQFITQEEVFEKYTGVKVQFNKLIKSPPILRVDNTPTCSFKYIGGKLKFSDWNGTFKGNCVDLVMYLYDLKFYQALDKIARDFNLIGSSAEIFVTKRVTYRNIKSIEPVDIFHAKEVPIIKEDLNYLTSYGISTETLNRFGIVSIVTIWKNKEPYWVRSKKDPAILYKGDGWFKVYFYKRKDYRFISKGTYIQGLSQLTYKSNICIITKSLKDVMFISQCGIDSIAPASENSYISREIINYLCARYEHVIVFFDPDAAGRRGAEHYNVNYGLPNIELTTTKDITDYSKAFGPLKAKNQLFNLLNPFING